jgi:hypothetical protein
VVYITTLLEDDFKGVNMNLPTRFSDWPVVLLFK